MTHADFVRSVMSEIEAQDRRRFRASVVVCCLALGAGILAWCILLKVLA